MPCTQNAHPFHIRIRHPGKLQVTRKSSQAAAVNAPLSRRGKRQCWVSFAAPGTNSCAPHAVRRAAPAACRWGGPFFLRP